MEIIKFATLEKKLIKHKEELVLLDKDVAELYQVEPKKLRHQVKGNIEKFPKDYAYKLDENEVDIMVSQNVTPLKQSFFWVVYHMYLPKKAYILLLLF